MRSLIILEVEHDADTDCLQDLIDECVSAVRPNNYTVRVDLPESFELTQGDQGTCENHKDVHAFNDECIGWRDSI